MAAKAICGMIEADYAYQLRHRQTGQTLADAMREYGMGVDPDHIEASVMTPLSITLFLSYISNREDICWMKICHWQL